MSSSKVNMFTVMGLEQIGNKWEIFIGNNLTLDIANERAKEFTLYGDIEVTVCQESEVAQRKAELELILILL